MVTEIVATKLSKSVSSTIILLSIFVTRSNVKENRKYEYVGTIWLKYYYINIIVVHNEPDSSIFTQWLFTL